VCGAGCWLAVTLDGARKGERLQAGVGMQHVYQEHQSTLSGGAVSR
jgi:hypothetical protein